jgi:protein TonB
MHQPTPREIEDDPNLPPIKPVERTWDKPLPPPPLEPPAPPPPRPAPKPRPTPKPSPTSPDDGDPNPPVPRTATPETPARSAPVRAETLAPARISAPAPSAAAATPKSPTPTRSSAPTGDTGARSTAPARPSTATTSGASATGGGAYEGPKANAAYLHNPKPDYPALAKRRQWEGKVILKVRVLADGKASQVSVATSSGHDILDEAAIEAVSQWHFVPAKRSGQAVESWVNVPINFNLLDAQ